MAEAYDPRITPARGDIAALHLRDLVEAGEYVSGQLTTVAVPAAPITGAPDGEAEMTSQLLFGEGFTVYEATAGWAWGQSALDGYVGYVPEADLIHAPAGEPTHRVRALQAIIYAEPDMKTRPIGAVPFGAKMILDREEGAFAALDPGGFTPLSALVPANEPDPLWVATAERFLGAPYLWAGRTPAGFDCSGLIQIALQAAGMSCPRDSDQQMAALGCTTQYGQAIQGLLGRSEPARLVGELYDETVSPNAFGSAQAIAVVDAAPTLGTNYCGPAVVNSSGASAEITASGSNVVAQNALALEASSLPPFQFGIFVVSATQDFVPGAGGASNGDLCLGGAIGRFTQPSQILNTGASGAFALAVDLAAIPQGAGFIGASAGDTWNFQAWFRDGVGMGSNFTDGLSITLE